MDQHSQSPLFRDGPGNALFTLVSVDTKGKGLPAPRAAAKSLKLDYLVGFTRWAIWSMQKPAPTAQTLFKNIGRPVRTIHLPKVDEFSHRRADDAFHAGNHHHGQIDGR